MCVCVFINLHSDKKPYTLHNASVVTMVVKQKTGENICWKVANLQHSLSYI